MKKRLLTVIMPIITIILEILPYGAVCNFMPSPEEELIRETYSYFNLTPFGYANFAPFITALGTCLILTMVVIYIISGKISIAKIARNTLAVITVISLGPLVFGINYFSIIGACITVLLGAETALMQYQLKHLR